MSLLIPSYKTGFAPLHGPPEYPNLWKRVRGLWAPSLGPTGLTLWDWSGYGNDGTLTNGPTWVTTPERGWSVDLPGNGESVYVGPFEAYSGNFSISLWFYPDTSGVNRLLIGQDATIPGADWIQIVAAGADNTVDFTFDSDPTKRNWSTTGSYADGQWNHLCVTRDLGSGYVSYLNGIADGSAAANGPINTGDDLWLGDHTGATASWNGRLGLVLIHERTLAFDEIQLLYHDPHALLRLRRPQRRTPAAAVGFVSRKHYIIGGGISL